MTAFHVIERQIRIVTYIIEAETEAETRAIVGALDANDYAILNDIPETEILSVTAALESSHVS